jgi:hypothetical protein
MGLMIERRPCERRYSYIVTASGAADVNGVRIDAREGALIQDVGVVGIVTIED